MANADAGHTIMIVEDSDDDYEAIVRALSKGRPLNNPLHRCEDGREALDYLSRRLQEAPDGATLPAIMILDLNLPGVDGRQVLAQLKCDNRLRLIPVVVMTNSDAERDVADCYRMGANTYIRKPFDWPAFFDTIQRLKEYWFEIAILPKA